MMTPPWIRRTAAVCLVATTSALTAGCYDTAPYEPPPGQQNDKSTGAGAPSDQCDGLAIGDPQDNPFLKIPPPAMPDPAHKAPPLTATATPNASSASGNASEAPPATLDFKTLVAKYLLSYAERKSNSQQQEIIAHIFAHAGTAEYVEDLQYLDAASVKNPAPIYSLARALQVSWEAQYGMGLGKLLEKGLRANELPMTHEQNQQTNIAIGRNAGGIMGAVVALIAVGAVMRGKLSAVSTYNGLFRTTMRLTLTTPGRLAMGTGFLAGYGAGTGVAHGINAYYDDGIPIAPAEILRLGASADDPQSDYDYAGIFKKVFPAATAEVAIFWLRQASKAGRVAAAAEGGANLAADAAALALWIAIDLGVTSLLEWREVTRLKDNLSNAADAVSFGNLVGDEGRIFEGADAVLQSALAYNAYYNRDLIDALESYSSALGQVRSQTPEGSEQRELAIGKLNRALMRMTQDSINSKPQIGDPDYDKYMALRYLKGQGNFDLLSDTARTHVGSLQAALVEYSRGFDSWLSCRETERGQTLGDQDINGEYGAYVDRYTRLMTEAMDRQLYVEMVQRKFPEHGGHILLQTAAYLSHEKNILLQEHIDTLWSYINKQQILTQAAMNWVAVPEPEEPTQDPTFKEPGTY